MVSEGGFICVCMHPPHACRACHTLTRKQVASMLLLLLVHKFGLLFAPSAALVLQCACMQ